MRQFVLVVLGISVLTPAFAETKSDTGTAGSARTKHTGTTSDTTLSTKKSVATNANLASKPFQLATELAALAPLRKAAVEQKTGKALKETSAGMMSSIPEPDAEVTKVDAFFDRQGRINSVLLHIQPKLNLSESAVKSSFGKPDHIKLFEDPFVQPKGKVLHYDYKLKKHVVNISFTKASAGRVATINIYEPASK